MRWKVTAALACGGAALGLICVVAFVNLSTARSLAGVVGTIVALAGAATSYCSDRRGRNQSASLAGGRDAIAAGGSITGNALGENAEVIDRVTSFSAPIRAARSRHHGEVEARGRGAIAARGDVSGNALGDGSRVERR